MAAPHVRTDTIAALKPGKLEQSGVSMYLPTVQEVYKAYGLGDGHKDMSAMLGKMFAADPQLMNVRWFLEAVETTSSTHIVIHSPCPSKDYIVAARHGMAAAAARKPYSPFLPVCDCGSTPEKGVKRHHKEDDTVD